MNPLYCLPAHNEAADESRLFDDDAAACVCWTHGRFDREVRNHRIEII
jgi:hypothetical protein